MPWTTKEVAAVAGAWFFAGLMIGCGGGGTDRCGGKCVGKEQCLAVDVEEKCMFFGICLRRGYTCVEPSKVTMPLSVEGSGLGGVPWSDTAAGGGGSDSTSKE